MNVETPRYRLELAPDGLRANLFSRRGDPLLALRPLAALDTVDGTDETLSVSPPRAVDGPVPTFEVERRSTRWERAGATLVCGDHALELRTWVRGRGVLTDVHLLGGRSLAPGTPTGFLPTGSTARTLFSPNPEDPDRPVRPAGEPAVVGVSGDSEPGRGRWLFTPAPLWLALGSADGWLGLGLAAPVEELTFVQLGYRPVGGAFSLVLEYEGHTRVDGKFDAPAVVLEPSLEDPYVGVARHRDHLVGRGFAPAPAARQTPAWWSEPIFCGWGAQCHLARADVRAARDFATQERYDEFLAHLERQGVVPGTVVVDDKWQEAYGTCEPDRAKWPNLRAWVAARHERGQRVLLWWKAWDPQGLPPELCVRTADGLPVAVDPGNPATRDALREIVSRMLERDGIGADGLKVDFTARTPSGTALSAAGPRWGIALLHELLELVYAAAKDAKRDALLVTHTPHPSFAGVTDMIRLNDMVSPGRPGRAAVTEQMRHRAEVVRAACPALLVDTDDWCVPDLEAWRAYLELKADLGVPALYYVSHLDATGESLTADDYEALRRTWARWREAQAAPPA